MSLNLDIRYPKERRCGSGVPAAAGTALASYGMEILEHRTTEMLYVPKDSELVRKLMEVYREGTERRAGTERQSAEGTYAKDVQKQWWHSDRCFRENRM